jgi:hypothetical protein
LKLLKLPPAGLNTMGKNSREVFDKRPSPDEIVKMIEDTYIGILYRKGALHE